jgi:hypothetical protein
MLVFSFPATSYFNFDQPGVTWQELILPGSAWTSFGAGGPQVTLSKNPVSSLYNNVITVKNLLLTGPTQPTSYTFVATGVRNPLAAKTISGVVCESWNSFGNVKQETY